MLKDAYLDLFADSGICFVEANGIKMIESLEPTADAYPVGKPFPVSDGVPVDQVERQNQ